MVLVDELPMEFHCDLQLKDRSLTVNGIASGAGGGVADGIPFCFATVGSFPQCKWDCGLQLSLCRSHCSGCVKVASCFGCMRNTIVFCSRTS